MKSSYLTSPMYCAILAVIVFSCIQFATLTLGSPQLHPFRPQIFSHSYQVHPTPSFPNKSMRSVDKTSHATVQSTHIQVQTNPPSPRLQTSFPSTFCFNCEHLYLLQLKPFLNMTRNAIQDHLNAKLYPYTLVHDISTELFIISGPVNPSIDLMFSLLPNSSLFKSTYVKNQGSEQATNQYFNSNLGLIDLLSLSQQDLLDLLQLTHTDGKLTPRSEQNDPSTFTPSDSPITEAEYIPVVIKFVQFLQLINNQLAGVIGLAHFDPTMKFSMKTLSQIQHFYIPQLPSSPSSSTSPQFDQDFGGNSAFKPVLDAEDQLDIDEDVYFADLISYLSPHPPALQDAQISSDSTQSNQKKQPNQPDLIFDLQKCLYNYYFPDNSTMSSLRATLGAYQIETDAFLDHLGAETDRNFENLSDFAHFTTYISHNTSTHPQNGQTDGNSTKSGQTNPILQPFQAFQEYSTSNNMFNYFLRNIRYHTVDEHGVAVNLLPYQPCMELMEKYTSLKAFLAKIESQLAPTTSTASTTSNTSKSTLNVQDPSETDTIELVAHNALEYESKELVLHINTMSGTHLKEVLTHVSENELCMGVFDDVKVSPFQQNQFNLYISDQRVPTKASLGLLQQFYRFQRNSHPNTSTLNNPTTNDISAFLHRYFAQFITKQDHLNKCLQYIAHHPYVVTIGIKPTVATLNHKTKLVLQDRNFSTTKMWTKKLTGKGQTVIVGDTGVDPDHCFFHDSARPITEYKSHIGPTNHDNPSRPDLSQRKIIWYVSNWGDELDDVQGHGTHVAGTVAGAVMPSDTDASTYAALSQYNGHGLDTKLIVLDFKNTGKNELRVPEDLYHEIFLPFTSRIESASISSHSWGGDTGYTSYALSTDTFCFNNPYHLVVFAAGNNGKSSYKTILSPGDSKNVLTVGASVQLADGQGVEITMNTGSAGGEVDPADVFTKKTIPYVNAAFTKALTMGSPTSLVVAENIEACEPLSKTQFNTVYTNATVFVRRGGCSFVTKANFVYTSGARAMILVNNISTPPTAMGVDTTTPTYSKPFYSAMISQRDGEPMIAVLEKYRALAPKGVDFTMNGPVTYRGPDSYSHAMADFSSRGPTKDGRIKPDIVAPGQAIYSARSDGKSKQSVNCLHPDRGGVYSNSGTSMATPAVSGELSLVRQYFETGHYAAYYNALVSPLSPVPNLIDQLQSAREIAQFTQPAFDEDTSARNDAITTLATTTTVPYLHTFPFQTQAGIKTDLAYLKNQYRITSAAMKSVTIASAQPATGQVLVSSSFVTSHYQNVTSSPMSPFQGWGIFNVDRALMFKEEAFTLIDSKKPITSQIQAPPSRLYVFDSLSEDVVNVRSILANDDDFVANVDAAIKERITAAQAEFKFDDKGQDFFRIDKLPGLIDSIVSPTQHTLSMKGETMVTSPYSFMLDSNSINYQRCAPIVGDVAPSIPIDSNKELYSCGLTINSLHSHCFTVQTEDIIHNLEFTIESGVQPSHTLIQQTITIENPTTGMSPTIPLIDIVFRDFANPISPVYNDPFITRASLVWTDPPGQLEAEKVLVNNIDLYMKVISHNYIVMNATHVALLRINNVETQDSLNSQQQQQLDQIQQEYFRNGSNFHPSALSEQGFYISSFIPIDWDKYRTLYPRAFQLADTVHAKHKINIAPNSTPTGEDITLFASPLLHLSTNNRVFNSGNSHSPYEHPKIVTNEAQKLFIDVINNVETTGLTFSSVNLNAYVLSAAIHLGQHLDVTYSVKSAQLATVFQHYALTITGALPSGIPLPTPPTSLDAQMETQEVELNPQNDKNDRKSDKEATQSLLSQFSPQQHTFGTCSPDSLQDLCPNNCSAHLSTSNKCVAGSCICGYSIIPPESTTSHYNAPIVVQYSGTDCSTESTVLSTLCNINNAGKSTDTRCVMNKSDETTSTPLIAPISDSVEPWEWTYYTIPAAIVQQALKLKALKEFQVTAASDSTSLFEDTVQSTQQDGGDEEKEPDDRESITPFVVVPDTVYIGIKFTVSAFNSAQPHFKGDPDLYISNTGYPTLSNFQYANRICDNCASASAKSNQDPIPRQPKTASGGFGTLDMTTMFFAPSRSAALDSVSNDFTDQNDDSRYDSTLYQTQSSQQRKAQGSIVQQNADKLQDILEQLHSVHGLNANSQNDTQNDSTFTPLGMSPLLAPTVPSNMTLPATLRADKDVIWIDGTYFDSSPLKTVTLGVYGNCCYKTKYTLSIFGVHTNSYPLIPDSNTSPITPTPPVPPTPTPKPDPTPVPVDPENRPVPGSDATKHDTFIFTVFFSICLLLFVLLCIVMCCKTYFNEFVQQSPFCAPIRSCCNFNKIPTGQEVKSDAQQRHGMLYRLLGCYYITTYCCFCFHSNTLSYENQHDDDEESFEVQESSSTIQDLPTMAQPVVKKGPNKKKGSNKVHRDGTNVADLGPISENPFMTGTTTTTAAKSVPKPSTTVQQSMDEFKHNSQTSISSAISSNFDDYYHDDDDDRFIIGQEQAFTPTAVTRHHFDDVLGSATTQWTLPEDTLHQSSNSTPTNPATPAGMTLPTTTTTTTMQQTSAARSQPKKGRRTNNNKPIDGRPHEHDYM